MSKNQKGNYTKLLTVAFSREWDCGNTKSNFYASYKNDLVVTKIFIFI